MYISDDYGLGNFERNLATKATLKIMIDLENARERNRRLAACFHDRRQRVQPRFDHSRWTLPPK